MNRSERNILIGLFVLIIIVVIGIGITFYVTRIVPEATAYQAQAYGSATARQIDRDVSRLQTQRALTPDG